jgi:copper chaperone
VEETTIPPRGICASVVIDIPPPRILRGQIPMHPTDDQLPADAREYRVRGMTCDHCIRSVFEEVSEISGVEYAEVSLDTGRLVVHGRAVTEAAVRAAIAEAGYEVA